MTALNTSTRRRLQKLQQIPSVWEGDRRLFSAASLASIVPEANTDGECILWVDGSQAVVRAMDVVAPEAGPEAIVRALLRAMEHPHSPARPARPQKIVVRDREVQFFLRGVLQELGITIDYAPELPLIDEIFRSFQDVVDSRPPQLPPQYAEGLIQQAFVIWQDAPWSWLEEHQILSVELNQWDIGTLYGSVMGMLGMEYGILLYRSLDSLKQFRQQILDEESLSQMEEAFLKQDCLFMTYESRAETIEDEDVDLAELPTSEIRPVFGNLHPLEGLRSFLHEEEALAMAVAMEALHRFFRQHHQKLSEEGFASINSRYRIPVPLAKAAGQPTSVGKPMSVQVATMPEVSMELVEMADSETDDADRPVLRDDLIPTDALTWLGVLSWEDIETLRAGAGYYESVNGHISAKGDGLPILFIQTSQRKAKTLIQDLQAAGGLQAICFNPGEDPLNDSSYELGLLQTKNSELHLVAEFFEDDSDYTANRKKWDQRCKKTKGYCGLVIAKGATGVDRGHPPLKDMMALFEARALSADELGLGPLELRLMIDWV